jgi:hypothetical protein
VEGRVISGADELNLLLSRRIRRSRHILMMTTRHFTGAPT